MAGRRVLRIVVALAAVVVLSPLVGIGGPGGVVTDATEATLADPGGADGLVPDAPQDGGPASAGTPGGPGPAGLVPIQNLSLQVRVPPGRAYYVRYDEAAGALTAMPLPDETAGLPPEAVAAADRAPAWVRPDLVRMLGRLADLPIDPTTADDFTAPSFVDMDGDGDQDLVLGDTAGRPVLYSNVDPALHYVAGSDVYVDALYVRNGTFFSSVVKSGAGYAHPAVGDLNGDNRPDLVIGGGDGRLAVFVNAGPPASPGWFVWGTVPTVSLGSFSAPALADLDGDGDLDLMVGGVAGTVYYVRNDGLDPWKVSDGDPATTTTPVWVGPQVAASVSGYASPALGDLNGDGRPEMAVGAGDGSVTSFSFDGSAWVADPSVYAGVTADARASPALADLDGDGLLDLVLGSRAGTVSLYPNVGAPDQPRHMVWGTYATGFDYTNFNQYYAPANRAFLTHRSATPRVLAYAAIVNAAPQPMVDEIAYSIAHANNASLLNPATFPEVYRNNTEAMYYNAQFTLYAQIVDYGLGTPDQWSTVRYRMNESGTLVWREYPRDIYYEWLVAPKGTDELATYIDPTVVASGHEGARDPGAGGVFWRWAAFNLASPSWPNDPMGRGYPKEEAPPVLRDKLANAAVLWNNTTYAMGAIYDAMGWFLRDGGGNVTRPWDATDQAVEIVDHWVASTVPLNAQAGGDANRPRQPVRIQWEHNGNCGEISDMTWAALRAALIPARGICGYGGDHCWGEFYERGWHQIDDYWDASISIIANDDNYHYGWNRDWSGLMAIRGDGYGVDVVDRYHREGNASNDAAYPSESRGLLDRANVTVVVTDASGHPLDGVKVAVGDYRYLGTWTSFGTQWTFTDAEGEAHLSTSEARQNWAADPNAGDPFDDGIAVYAIGKFGAQGLGTTYADRLKPSYGDAYNARNAPMNYYNITLGGVLPRPGLAAAPVAPPSSGAYALNVSYHVVSAVQHPAVAVRWNEGLADHDLEIATGRRVTSFVAADAEFRAFRGLRPFQAVQLRENATEGAFTLGLPDGGGDWYFVLANPGALETVQVVDLSVQLAVVAPEERRIDITPSMLGLRLMSLPLRPVDPRIEAVLGSVAGSFDFVRWYDPLGGRDAWRSYMPAKAYNTLRELDETMGFWINFTRPCTLVVTGYPRPSTAIAMRAGWNLVGYPSDANTYTAGDLIAELGTGARVEAFDGGAPPYYLRVPATLDPLRAWEGYWIWVSQARSWLVLR